jgi:predicted N-formylglutamate amidohydrolase
VCHAFDYWCTRVLVSPHTKRHQSQSSIIKPVSRKQQQQQAAATKSVITSLHDWVPAVKNVARPWERLHNQT